MSWCLMNEVTMNLTDVASLSIRDNISVFRVDLQALDQVGELRTYHYETL